MEGGFSARFLSLLASSACDQGTELSSKTFALVCRRPPVRTEMEMLTVTYECLRTPTVKICCHTRAFDS